MPRVPTYDNFQAAPNTLPNVRLQAPDMPDVAGQQAQQMGRAMMAGGQQIGQIALDMQQMVDQLRVDDALNRVKETALRLTYDKDAGFANLKGINALERPGGKPLAEEYAEALKRSIDDISATLGNDVQRQAFAARANDILTAMRGDAIQHEAREFKTYALSISDGVQSTALREISLNWKNPDAVNSAINRIRAATYRQAQLLGKSAEWWEARVREMISNAHKLALTSALEQNDLPYAEAYLQKYGDQMNADDILAVRSRITKAMDTMVGFEVANDIMGQVLPSTGISEVQRAFNIAVNTESGGKQFDSKGKPLTSPKGAIGIAQVMPKTGPEAARLAGVPWDEHRYRTDAKYNWMIGFAYFQEQLRVNNGDLAKAYAAYNAGPGRLAKAIQKAEKSAKLAKTDPKVPVRSWLEFMPKETRDYVAKNMREYEAGQGQPTRPTFQEIDDRLRADPRLAGNPGRYQVAREEAKRLYEEQTQAIKQREDEAIAEAMRGIIQNGGRFFGLPLRTRLGVPPSAVGKLIDFADKIAKGNDTSDMQLYAELAGNLDRLARMTDAEFFALRMRLSEADFRYFARERGKRTGAAPGVGEPGDLNSQAIKNVLDERLRILGMDPTPKEGSQAAMRIGAIRKFVNDYFTAAQAEAGKKFTDAEVAAHIDNLFAKNATFRGWFSTSSGPMLTMKVGDIPRAERDAIEAAFKRHGVDNPSDAQVLDIYWKRQLLRK